MRRLSLALVPLALAVLACVCSSSSTLSPTPTLFEIASPAPTEVAVETAAEPPTAAPTLQPVDATEAAAPAPTEPPTAAPTNTAEPSPTSAPPAEPITLTGTAQNVTDPVSIPFTFSRVHLETQTAGYFGVKSYDAAGNSELLANAVSPYAGTTVLVGAGEYTFEVDADGPWTITIEAVPDQPDAATSFTGKGDTVSGWFTPPAGTAAYTFTHDGAAYFGVQVYCAGGDHDLAQNEIGAVNNTAMIRFRSSPCFWVVQGDGNWTIAPK